MINGDDLTRQDSLYMYKNKAWKITEYCPGPSVTMTCIGTHEKVNFGLGDILDQDFKEIKEVGKR